MSVQDMTEGRYHGPSLAGKTCIGGVFQGHGKEFGVLALVGDFREKKPEQDHIFLITYHDVFTDLGERST